MNEGTARILHIRSRHREHMGVVASLADFNWRPGEPLAAAHLLDDPRISLYCLDHASRRAIFTALPAGVDPLQAPFMYQAQFDHAEHLIALPYADFLQLAEQMPVTRPQILCLHNIGRCGSTVLCRALGELDGLIAFSEPDSLTNFIYLRSTPRVERLRLLRACVAWLCRPAIIGGNTRLLFKFRNQASAGMDLYLEALPEAAHLFLYRNVIDWLASFHRLRSRRGDRPTRYTREEIIKQQADYYACPADVFEKLAHPSIQSYLSLEGRALGWLFMLGTYLELRAHGAEIAALRYEDIQADRDAVLLLLLEMLTLPAESLEAARRGFQTDAQAGTAFARDDARGNTLALPDAMQATVRRLLSLQPVLRRPDQDLPGTMRPKLIN